MAGLLQICGSAPDVPDIPVLSGAERWILGAAYQEQGHLPWSRVFDVHSRWHIATRRPDAIRWYSRQALPVYLMEAMPEVPRAILWDDNWLEPFGPRGMNAISSSIDRMMALAILEGFTTIRLEGVRMETIWEWETQRECLAYWIGQAEGRGIEVVTDFWSALCTPETIYATDRATGATRNPGKPRAALPIGEMAI